MATIYMTDQCCPCEGLTDPCCVIDQECCPYPADLLASGFYDASDLPDSVFLDSGNGPIEAQRIGNTFVIEDGFAEGQDVVLGLNGTTWGLWVEAGLGPEFIIGDYNGTCLINFYDVEVPIPIISDNFADTYNVIGFGAAVPVERKSLCRWEKFGHIVTAEGQLRRYNAGLEYVIDFNEDGSVEYVGWKAFIGYVAIAPDQGNDDAGPAPTQGSMSSPINIYTDPISGTNIIVSAI